MIIVGQTARLWRRGVRWWTNRVDRLRIRLAAGAVLRALRAPDPVLDLELVFGTARRLAAVGLVRQALAVIDRAERLGADPRVVVRTRRALPRYGGRVSRPVLRRAAVAAGAGAMSWPSRTPVACLEGRGADVDAVVRHRLPGGRSMIRKTLLGDQPREVSAYLSGQLTGGRGWRIPRLYHAEPEVGPQGARWHLFLEDLGPVDRLEAPGQILAAARALGELNGGRLGDQRLGSVSWLTDRTEPYERFEDLRHVAEAVPGTVRAETANRLIGVLDQLSLRRIELRDRFLELPKTLCHGDPTRSNLTQRGPQLIMFDLSSCAYGPIGSDLGGLVALPNPGVRHRRLSIQDCLQAYLSGIEQTAGRMDPTLVGFGFRYRLLIKSLGWQLTRLPPRFDAPDPGLTAERIRIKRASVEADLDWLCEQAMILLGHDRL